MESISREALFSPEMESESPEFTVKQLDFTIEAVDGPKFADDEPELEEFCLFGDETIKVADLEAPDDIEEARSGRPLTYYFYESTPDHKERCKLAAVEGHMAAAWSTANASAPDINSDYKPQSRRCRPGSATRRNKYMKNKRREEERKEKQKLDMLRRRARNVRRGRGGRRQT